LPLSTHSPSTTGIAGEGTQLNTFQKHFGTNVPGFFLILMQAPIY